MPSHARCSVPDAAVQLQSHALLAALAPVAASQTSVRRGPVAAHLRRAASIIRCVGPAAAGFPRARRWAVCRATAAGACAAIGGGQSRAYFAVVIPWLVSARSWPTRSSVSFRHHSAKKGRKEKRDSRAHRPMSAGIRAVNGAMLLPFITIATGPKSGTPASSLWRSSTA